MSAIDQPTGDRCGKWMPRAKDHFGRRFGHRTECRTAAAIADRRERLTERRRGQTLVTPGGQVPMESGVQAKAHSTPTWPRAQPVRYQAGLSAGCSTVLAWPRLPVSSRR